jgi:L-amino acid N-acyltransferase YncA
LQQARRLSGDPSHPRHVTGVTVLLVSRMSRKDAIALGTSLFCDRTPASVNPRQSRTVRAAVKTTIRLAKASDAAAVAEIYNQGISDRTATFETELRTAEQIGARLDDTDWPVLIIEAEGKVLGWAGLSGYRTRSCYAGIAEFSIYLDRAARGRGLARGLLQALIDEAGRRGFWKLVSRIFPSNAASRAVCRATGFREVGVYEKHGCLDGQWMDVVIVERLIPENIVVRPTR